MALAALGLAGQEAHAQAAPLSYWTPGWPIGFGGGLSRGQFDETYGNFPSFDGRDGADAGFHYKFPNGFFVDSGSRTAYGLSGIGQGGAFGNFTTQSVQFGYNFQNSPLRVFGGFDTLKYDTGAAGGPFAAFDSNSSSTAGFGGYAGVEFKPASNVSLSLGVGYSQQNDVTSFALPGTSPFGPRR